MTGQTPYAGIKAIIEATEIKKVKPDIENPYKENDILVLKYMLSGKYMQHIKS